MLIYCASKIQHNLEAGNWICCNAEMWKRKAFRVYVGSGQARSYTGNARGESEDVPDIFALTLYARLIAWDALVTLWRQALWM